MKNLLIEKLPYLTSGKPISVQRILADLLKNEFKGLL